MRTPAARTYTGPVGATLRPCAPVVGLAAVAALGLAPTSASGQTGCEVGEGTEQYVQEPIPGGGRLGYWTKPHFICEDGVEIWADSAVSNSALGMSHLMGSVRYTDRTREMRADTARYFSDHGRLQASGHVYIRDESDGSEVSNGDLVYLRQTDFRSVESMLVTTGRDGVRPRALVRPASPDSAAAGAPRPDPYAVVGDRIELRGDSYFKAVGTVEIEQDSLLAFADSAEYDEAAGVLVLDGAARVVSRDTELVGRTVTVDSPGTASSRIHAVRQAVLTGDGLLLLSPQIVVFLVDGGVQRLVAMPIRAAQGAPRPDSADLVRPVATLEDATLTADSLDIVAPDEVVDRVVAVGRARSVSTARDSLNTELLPETARSDWLEGDTVIVELRPEAASPTGGDSLPEAREIPTQVADPPVPADPPPGASARPKRYEIETITAVGGAKALYRLPPSDTTARTGVDPPALHYVVGQRIEIAMLDGDVDAMTVVGQTRGVHLEPLPRAPTPPDSTSAGTDTLSAPGAVGRARGEAREAPGAGRAPPRAPVPDTARPETESTAREETPWRGE